MICKETLRICGATAVAVILMLWSNPSWGITLTWNANTEADLAGYYIYQCSQQPCSKTSGTATRLATLGKVTSLNVGTPAVIQYYLITAYDFANNESNESMVATYIPAGTPPPPDSATVNLTVVGSPTSGQPWSVQATTNAAGTVSTQVWVNGVLDHTEAVSPYCAFGDNGTACTTVLKPYGTYTMEFRVLSNGIEVARQTVVVTASALSGPAPPPVAPSAATAMLTVVGSPTSGQPWSVQATTNAAGTVSTQVWINGVLDHTEAVSPYCAFGDNGTACTTVLKPYGTYTMEFRVLSNGIEVARQSIVVKATATASGASPPPATASVGLTVVGSPTLGQPWSVQATTNAAGTVSMQVWVNGAFDHTEGVSPYCAFGDNGTACTTVLKPKGTYTMEFRVLSNGIEVTRQAMVVTAK
ncbi:MAG: hypothetical protein BVN29_12305 [Nitrospira sp. ST-bin5]|nr:MAG: hypothetical protein BVN29_12305 [Nitrospira sp. ST-bin5]